MPDLPHSTELSHSPDTLAQRRAELLEVLSTTHPELISDNQLDLQKLQDLLNPEQWAEPKEHYELTWAGKTAARREVQKTTSHTLRPSAGNPAQAPHMLIEGENLEVLRVLQRSYYGKVKMIYIDPPYNTGNDSFVYPDDYSETLDEYLKRTGEKSEAGFLNKQSLWKKNSKESGQYHSAWLSMMYPRLYLARNLLRDDGVIFISIDDNEAANLKLLCDEVFGTGNFVTTLVWKKKQGGGNDSNTVIVEHEYIHCYSKNAKQVRLNLDTNYKLDDALYPFHDDDGDYGLVTLDKSSIQFSQSLVFEIVDAQGNKYVPRVINGKQSCWRWGRSKVSECFDKLVFKNGKVYTKYYRPKGVVPKSLLTDPSYGRTESGNDDIKEIFGNSPFNYPKPKILLKHLLQIGSDAHDVVFDFFAGSGTTAHAVMELNAEHGGHRRCISVQMPEVLDESSEAYKAGYRTIADITRARIDKVIAKLKAEHPDQTQGLACAHFTLAPSNFKVWRADVNDVDALREQLALFKQSEKTSPTPSAPAQAAMLAELLLKHGLGALGVDAVSDPLPVGAATVHRVTLPDARALWLCFDAYTPALKAAIVAAKPAQVVMLNSCFAGPKADEQLANLQLELASLSIGLTVI